MNAFFLECFPEHKSAQNTINCVNTDTLFCDCTDMIRNLKCSEIVIDALVQAGSEFLKK